MNTSTDPELGLVINDVNASVWHFIKHHYWRESLILLPVIGAWYYLLIRYGAPIIFNSGTTYSHGNGSGRGFGTLLALPFGLLASWYIRLKKKFEDAFLRDFAAGNGYSYDLAGAVDETYGTLFRVGHDGKVSDVVSGTYQNSDLRLFLYDVTVGSGRSSATYRNTVIEIDTKGKLPAMLLIGKTHRFSTGLNLAGSYETKNTISLEGDFNDHFTLYAAPGTQIEALEVFAPDVMALLADETSSFDIEFIANRIYIYVDGYITTNDKLRQAFRLAKQLVEQVAPIAGRLGNDSAITTPTINLVSRGTSPRTRASLIATGLFIAAAVAMGGVGAAVSIISANPPESLSTKSDAADQARNAAVHQAITDEAASSASHNLGVKLVTDGQAVLETALNDRDRSDGEYWIGLGYFWQNQPDTALVHEFQALQYDAKNSHALVTAGDLQVNLGQNSAAITTANRELDIIPDDQAAFAVRAFAEYNLGQRDTAITDINTAVAYAEAGGNAQIIAAMTADRTLIKTTKSTALKFLP